MMPCGPGTCRPSAVFRQRPACRQRENAWGFRFRKKESQRKTVGTKVTRQRLDSTHVLSSIAVLTRLGLFYETIRHFLKTLAGPHPRLGGRVPVRLRLRCLKEDGGASAYQDAPSGTGKRRLPVCSRRVSPLSCLRARRPRAWPPGRCCSACYPGNATLSAGRQRPSAVDDDAGEGGVPVVLKAAEDVGSDSLQSPYDAEATYNARKGKGYEVQIAETCAEAAPDDKAHTVNVITWRWGPSLEAWRRALQALQYPG